MNTKKLHAPLGRGVLVGLLGALTASVVAPGVATAASSGSTLTYNVEAPFTGTTAFIGPGQLAGCLAAVKVINENGGVLGHDVQCTETNTQGDPADAVPATQKMLATTSNVVAEIGPPVTAPSTYKLFAADHIPMFSGCGAAFFNHNKTPYFYRLEPSDTEAGIAMAYWAKKHYPNGAAELFTNSTGGETTVPPLLKEYTSLGGKWVYKAIILPGETSYQSQIESLLKTHPKVIITEEDPATAGTFFGELRQLDKGPFPKVEVTDLGVKPAWIKAAIDAVGKSTLEKDFVAVSEVTPKGPGFATYKKAETSSTVAAKVTNPAQDATTAYTVADYTAGVIAALAMTEAKTTNPEVWNKKVLSIANGTPGAVTVHTYAAGLKAIKQGKKVHYLGAYGAFDFNKYQNGQGAFQIFSYNPKSKSETVVGTIGLAEMGKLSAAY